MDVGVEEGFVVVGASVGNGEGIDEGVTESLFVGLGVAFSAKIGVGSLEGLTVGYWDGTFEGADEGVDVGRRVGNNEGVVDTEVEGLIICDCLSSIQASAISEENSSAADESDRTDPRPSVMRKLWYLSERVQDDNSDLKSNLASIRTVSIKP